ncbi:MAG: hypothetical protein HKN40_07690 [Winogradskyella sp.]|uniref:hypothetical protein n=1 Tax=Winogradskyella sp. TaxID=1883156 RepID=UPI001826489F|nr:hypothetical protein [Winogradskyella sp.]
MEQQEQPQFKFPTETVELPSKGLLYPEDHPLASGTIEMKYMTAKEEDILTNQNYISQGIVLDKLLQSLIVTKVKYDDLFVGDKNAIMIASRILGYGKDYEFEYNGEEHTIDLTTLDNKQIDESLFTRGQNEFEFELPFSKTLVTFQLMNGHLEKKVEQEIKGLKKINKTASPDLSTRMKHLITSVDGNRDTKTIRDFVDNYLLARDSRSLRQHVADFQPDIDLEITIISQGEDKAIDIPIGVNFFFPDA